MRIDKLVDKGIEHIKRNVLLFSVFWNVASVVIIYTQTESIALLGLCILSTFIIVKLVKNSFAKQWLNDVFKNAKSISSLTDLRDEILKRNFIKEDLVITAYGASFKQMCKNIANNKPISTKRSLFNEEQQSSSKSLPENINDQRTALLELASLCLKSPLNTELVDLINNLEDHTGHEEYITTLNYFIDHSYQINSVFIIYLDWKSEIEILRRGIESLLISNFNITIELPNENQYQSRASVSYPNVFSDFDSSLNEIGFQLSFIDTNADDYAVLVHKSSESHRIVQNVNKLGYDCLTTKSKKITG